MKPEFSECRKRAILTHMVKEALCHKPAGRHRKCLHQIRAMLACCALKMCIVATDEDGAEYFVIAHHLVATPLQFFPSDPRLPFRRQVNLRIDLAVQIMEDNPALLDPRLA